MTQFENDLKVPLIINGTNSSRAFFNLTLSIRDVNLWSKGIKPHRHWRIGDVKKYFGVKGDVNKIIKELELLKEKHFPKN